MKMNLPCLKYKKSLQWEHLNMLVPIWFLCQHKLYPDAKKKATTTTKAANLVSDFLLFYVPLLCIFGLKTSPGCQP